MYVHDRSGLHTKGETETDLYTRTDGLQVRKLSDTSVVDLGLDCCKAVERVLAPYFSQHLVTGVGVPRNSTGSFDVRVDPVVIAGGVEG